MKKVQRTKGIRRAVRTGLLGKPRPRYVTAGSGACGRLMESARPRIPGPSDSAILAWALFDLDRELMGGYWQRSAA